MEKCLILIKPDGISRGLLPMIVEHINNAGLGICEKEFLTASVEQCRDHYNIKVRNYGATEEQIVHYLSKSYIKNGNICVLVVVGINAVEKAFEIKTKIRKDFALDTLEKCTAEGRALHNVMHSSETADDAEKEIKVWLNRDIV